MIDTMIFCKECYDLFFVDGLPKTCPVCKGVFIKNVTNNPKYCRMLSNTTVCEEAEKEMNKIFKDANRYPNGELIDGDIEIQVNSKDPLTIMAREAVNDTI